MHIYFVILQFPIQYGHDDNTALNCPFKNPHSLNNSIAPIIDDNIKKALLYSPRKFSIIVYTDDIMDMCTYGGM